MISNVKERQDKKNTIQWVFHSPAPESLESENGTDRLHYIILLYVHYIILLLY